MESIQATETTNDLSIDHVDNRPTVRSHRVVSLHCPRGRVEAYYYPAPAGKRAVMMVGGVGERQDSPAANAFTLVAEDLQHRRTPSLRLRLRAPGDPAESLYDLRLGLRFLEAEGRGEFAVAGFGPGAAALLRAAPLEPAVTAAALLSLPVEATATAGELAARVRWLVMQGGRDAGTAVNALKRLYERMSDPKEMLILPRATRTLNENSTEVHMRLREWLETWRRS